MIQAIITGIFSLILQFFDLLFKPILSVIYALFPNLSTYFSYITTFLNYCFTYLGTCLRLLLINNTMMSAFFDYIIICYTIHITVIGVKFIINIYNKFKI